MLLDSIWKVIFKKYVTSKNTKILTGYKKGWRVIWGKQGSIFIPDLRVCCQIYCIGAFCSCIGKLITEGRNLLSTVIKVGFQRLVFEMFSIRGKYLLCFLILAASIPSSAGHINSIRSNFFSFADHMQMSGRSFVL